MCGARDADRAGPIVEQAVGWHLGALRHGAASAPVRPGDDEVVDVVGADAGLLPQALERLGPELGVAHLAEALLPHPGPLLTGDAPAVDELIGQRHPRPQLGDDVAVVTTSDDQCSRTVAEVRLVGPAGQAGPHVGRDRQGRTGLADGGPQGAHGAAHRADDVVRAALIGEPQRRLDAGGVRPVEVGRRHRCEPDRLDRCVGRAPPRHAGRLDRHGRGVLVERGHRTRALAPPTAGDVRHRGEVESPVRDVAAESDDAVHARSVPPASMYLLSNQGGRRGTAGRKSGDRDRRGARHRPGACPRVGQARGAGRGQRPRVVRARRGQRAETPI